LTQGNTAQQNYEKDIKALEHYAENFTETLNKLSEISQNVSQILAVQEVRLKYIEKSQEDMVEVAENRRVEVNNLLLRIDQRLEALEKSFVNIKGKEDNSSKDITDLQTKVSRLEKWSYIVVGGFIIITFLIKELNILSAL